MERLPVLNGWHNTVMERLPVLYGWHNLVVGRLPVLYGWSYNKIDYLSLKNVD